MNDLTLFLGACMVIGVVIMLPSLLEREKNDE